MTRFHDAACDCWRKHPTSEASTPPARRGAHKTQHQHNTHLAAVAAAAAARATAEPLGGGDVPLPAANGHGALPDRE